MDTELNPQTIPQQLDETPEYLKQDKTVETKPLLRSMIKANTMIKLQKEYGYSEYMSEEMLRLMTPEEVLEMAEERENPKPVTIRTNTLQTTKASLVRKLKRRQIMVKDVGEWCDEALQVFTTDQPIGATVAYLTGDYSIQTAASFLPVIALGPQKGERIVDMCAAPGGKTSHIAALMENTGVIYANDSSESRIKSLQSNLARCHVSNTVLSLMDSTSFPQHVKNVDRVLLDAPCSGSGVVGKFYESKVIQKNDIVEYGRMQRKLLEAAIKTCKPGGIIVYSTCSICIHENENVVDWFIQNKMVKCLPIPEIPFGKTGIVRTGVIKFSEQLLNAKRFYANFHNMDGFFVAKLQVLPRKRSFQRTFDKTRK